MGRNGRLGVGFPDKNSLAPILNQNVPGAANSYSKRVFRFPCVTFFSNKT